LPFEVTASDVDVQHQRNPHHTCWGLFVEIWKAPCIELKKKLEHIYENDKKNMRLGEFHGNIYPQDQQTSQ